MRFSVTVPLAKAYGPRKPDAVQRVPIKHFIEVRAADPEELAQGHAHGPGGHH